MSDYDLFGDYEPEQPATLEEDRPEPEPRSSRKTSQKRSGGGGGFYNFVSVVFLLATVVVAVMIVMLVQNPMLPFNPFPPPPPPPTPTLFLLDGGGSSSDIPPTQTPAPTNTRVPTTMPQTAQVQITATMTLTLALNPTGLMALPAGTNTVSVMPFTLQNEAVTYTQNTNSQGCAWLSIAGQVFDINGSPLPGLPIRVTGENFERIEFTGTAKAFGESGYEILLNTTPIEAEFLIQLMNTTGQPLSEPIVVRTLSSCERNVSIVNFIQNHTFSP